MPKQRVKDNLDGRMIQILPDHGKKNRGVNMVDRKAGKGGSKPVSENLSICPSPSLHSQMPLCNQMHENDPSEPQSAITFPAKEEGNVLLSRVPFYGYQPPRFHNLSSNGRYLASSGQFQNRVPTNSRERWRQQTVNNAFAQLRQIIPTHPTEKKMSKADILRSTIKYISILNKVVEYQNELCESENKENGNSVQQTGSLSNIGKSSMSGSNVKILDLKDTESEEEY